MSKNGSAPQSDFEEKFGITRVQELAAKRSRRLQTPLTTLDLGVRHEELEKACSVAAKPKVRC